MPGDDEAGSEVVQPTTATAASPGVLGTLRRRGPEGLVDDLRSALGLWSGTEYGDPVAMEMSPFRRLAILMFVRTHDFTGTPMALSLRQRVVGLIGCRNPSTSSLLIPDCSAVHTFFMRVALDLVFLDDKDQVLGVKAALPPWRVAFGARGTKGVLELPSGTISRREIMLGHQLLFDI